MAFTESRLGQWHDGNVMHQRQKPFIHVARASELLTLKFSVAFAASLHHRCWERPHPTTSGLMSISRNRKVLLS